MTINEVAPPGFGHTKGDKKKGVEKGGTAAAFDRARKEGRFKGSKSDMFAIMWSQKNKGDKPHYKPGTDKKYKKYQDDEKNESFEIDKTEHKKKQKERKMRNLAIKNPNENESKVAHKKAGGPKLYGEGAAWTKKSGKNPEGGLNEKGRKSYERDNPGSDLKAPQPEGGSRKKSFCARMGGMKKKLTSSKTANDPDSRINKALRKWKCNETVAGGVPLTPQELEIQKKMSRLNVRLARKRNQQMQKAKTDDTESAPEQVKEEDKAFNYVVAKLKKQHGDGVLTKRDKMKPQSAADKAKARAHQAKVDKENAAERAKDPSQGRYPKG